MSTCSGASRPQNRPTSAWRMTCGPRPVALIFQPRRKYRASAVMLQVLSIHDSRRPNQLRLCDGKFILPCLPIGHGFAEVPPKYRRMAVLFEVYQFMSYHIVNEPHRQLGPDPASDRPERSRFPAAHRSLQHLPVTTFGRTDTFKQIPLSQLLQIHLYLAYRDTNTFR